MGGRDWAAGEGEGDELKIGDVEVMERASRGSPERGGAGPPWRGGEVEPEVATMEVVAVGGRGRLEGLIPAARHCSRRDATVFFLGLDVPRPR